MFQTIQFPGFLNFRPSLALRSVLLFAIACFSVIALPLVTDYVMHADWLPGNAAVPFQSINYSVESSFSTALTHQEPNFYQ